MLRSLRVLFPVTVASIILGACGGGNAASQLARAPNYDPKGQTKCSIEKSQAKPLIVEWPSADRGELEAQAHNRGLVVVRYSGCEMQVLDGCTTSVKYGYAPITRKKDRVVMRDADDLYANVPIGAARLEAKLEKSGELDVDMTMVGRWEAERRTVRADELQGLCDGATHVVSALTVGAFTFTAGADATVGGSTTVLGAGGGGHSTSRRETLNADGDASACEKSTAGDKLPPDGCGAMLRVEVVPLVGVAQVVTPPAAAAPASARPSGGSCPAGMASLPGGRFTMGSGANMSGMVQPSGDRNDSVMVQPFCMDITEVTADAYAACVRSGSCSADGLNQDGPQCNYGVSGKGNHPINCVDWGQSVSYCLAQGKRLPTEEEWEWAARGGSRGGHYPWGSAEPASQFCWSGVQKRDGTCVVGSFPEGDAPGGIHDLTGNVWEWTQSNFDATGASRVIRGGCWSDVNVFAVWIRSSHAPAIRDNNQGFRCAR